ncbi:hypothetical protein M8C21_027547 [Ambrosia artemisiifolia]|uniref:Uncharacterized protein n=1 Tax=Ambrosia artemisiifolia TaxID=4212 RepID=A0AAD5GUR6_AMBAR|nr:hypothetical protein M8C21_027547 [Ambrosia artemisiifolia]
MDFHLQDPPSNMVPPFSSPPRAVILNNFAGDVTVVGFGRGQPLSVERNTTSIDEVEGV